MRYILAALAVLTLSAAVASANGLGFYGSFWKPEDLDNAFGAGAKMQIEIVPSIFAEARAGYFPKAKDKDEDDFEVDIIPLEAAGIIKFPVDQITPYGGAGAGYYMFRVAKEPDGVSADIENKIGFFAVAGLELALGDSASLFGEAKYTWLKDVEVEAKAGGVSAKDEGDLTGFGANVGILLKW